jgi:hypothetical protein
MEKKTLMGFAVVVLLLCSINTVSARLLGEAPFSNQIGSSSTFSTAHYYLKYQTASPVLVIFDQELAEGDDGKVFRFDKTSSGFSAVVALLTNSRPPGGGTPIEHGIRITGAGAPTYTTDPFLNPKGFTAYPGTGVDFVGYSIEYMEMVINSVTFEKNTMNGTTVKIAGSFRVFGEEAAAIPKPATQVPARSPIVDKKVIIRP